MPALRAGRVAVLTILGAVTVSIFTGCDSSPDALPLSISPAIAAMKGGDTTRFTLIRGGAPVEAEWATDSPATIAIDGNGTARGVSRGTSNIMATTTSGLHAERRLSVVSDISGRWTGSFVESNCRHLPGAGPNTCRSGPKDGTSLFEVSQTREEIAGRLVLDYRGGVSIVGSFKGSVAVSGAIAATADVSAPEVEATGTPSGDLGRVAEPIR